MDKPGRISKQMESLRSLNRRCLSALQKERVTSEDGIRALERALIEAESEQTIQDGRVRHQISEECLSIPRSEWAQNRKLLLKCYQMLLSLESQINWLEYGPSEFGGGFGDMGDMGHFEEPFKNKSIVRSRVEEPVFDKDEVIRNIIRQIDALKMSQDPSSKVDLVESLSRSNDLLHVKGEPLMMEKSEQTPGFANRAESSSVQNEIGPKITFESIRKHSFGAGDVQTSEECPNELDILRAKLEKAKSSKRKYKRSCLQLLSFIGDTRKQIDAQEKKTLLEINDEVGEQHLQDKDDEEHEDVTKVEEMSSVSGRGTGRFSSSPPTPRMEDLAEADDAEESSGNVDLSHWYLSQMDNTIEKLRDGMSSIEVLRAELQRVDIQPNSSRFEQYHQ